jgi:hypothetical protein
MAGGEADAEEMVGALRAATVDELVELYVDGGDFWGVGQFCFRVLQRRPKGRTLAKGFELAEADDPERRKFACSLLTMGMMRRGRSARRALKTLEGLLSDHEESVIEAAIQAFANLQVAWSSAEFAGRVRADTGPDWEPPNEPIASYVDVGLLEPFAVHPSDRLRFHLALALWPFGDERSTQMLLTLVRDEDKDIRGAALGECRWKRYTGGVTKAVLAALWEASRDADRSIRVDAVTALVELAQPGSVELFEHELRTALAEGTPHGAVYPIVDLLYRPISAILPPELREQACHRWAKDLVGKGPPPWLPNTVTQG